jgi:hypothetical protein
VEGLQLFEVPAILRTSRETLEADDAAQAGDTSRLCSNLGVDRIFDHGVVVKRRQP